MAHISRICPHCDSPIVAQIGQHADREHCRWFEARHCPDCGYAVEIDGDEEAIDPNIRQAILDQEGEWTLSLPNYRRDALQTAKVLRRLFGLSLPEVQIIIRPQHSALMSGTRAEMAWLAYILGREGIQGEISPSDAVPIVRLTVTPQGRYGIVIGG